MNDYLTKKRAEAGAKAHNYFYNQKQRKPFYCAEGSTCDDCCSHQEAFFHFTDEEIAHIKTLIIDEANKSGDSQQPISTVNEALEVFSFGDLFAENEELRHLLQERCEEVNLDLENIDFDTPCYFYKFSILFFDYEENKPIGPLPTEIILSDEDYLTLLTHQLMNREYFNFNSLLVSHPDLARKLNSSTTFGTIRPFTILFDEVRADAEAIDGPAPTFVEIVTDCNDARLFHVLAQVESRVLTIVEEEMVQSHLFSEQRILDNIDVNKVMQHLEAKDYPEMFDKLSKAFNTLGCFDDIKAMLIQYDIPFNEK